MKAGDRFTTHDGLLITVKRVSKEQWWADILVIQESTGQRWTKRQKLLSTGQFAFDVTEVAS